VVKKTKKRVKHIPQRTCVGCREILAKRTLIRVVRTPEGVIVDLEGKTPGRGAYLHDRPACWQKGLKGSLASALRIEITPENRLRLEEFAATLTEEPATLEQVTGGSQ
jgi:predicted RNA-binding protein YlxR (DUF448 family)